MILSNHTLIVFSDSIITYAQYAMRCCRRLAWALFVLFSTLVCCQPTELFFCFFFPINFPILLPRSLLGVELTITADFVWDEKIHGASELFHIIVEVFCAQLPSSPRFFFFDFFYFVHKCTKSLHRTTTELTFSTTSPLCLNSGLSRSPTSSTSLSGLLSLSLPSISSRFVGNSLHRISFVLPSAVLLASIGLFLSLSLSFFFFFFLIYI